MPSCSRVIAPVRISTLGDWNDILKAGGIFYITRELNDRFTTVFT